MTEKGDPSNNAKLFVLEPTRGGRPVELVRPLYVVGRSRHADIQIQHRAVSKLHAVLFNCDGVLFVRDLASTNGTRVNGQRVRLGALLPGDKISFAGCSFRVVVRPHGAVEEQSLEKTELMVAQVDTPPHANDDSSPVIRVIPARRHR